MTDELQNHPFAQSAISRRRFLTVGSLALAATVLRSKSSAQNAPAPGGTFEMTPLPYGYDALEPSIDGTTMRLHYDKHYGAYTANLNAALKDFPTLREKSIEPLLADIASLPESIRKAVRNNGGGYYNHGFFWKIMTPQSETPEGALGVAINETFGGVDGLKKAFSAAAASVFGSGWAWLIVKDGKLEITTTPNQDSPIMTGIAEKTGTPVLGLDVWEHAYYLKYKNERARYIGAWWNVVNWKAAGQFYSDAVA